MKLDIMYFLLIIALEPLELFLYLLEAKLDVDLQEIKQKLEEILKPNAITIGTALSGTHTSTKAEHFFFPASHKGLLKSILQVCISLKNPNKQTKRSV